MVYVGGKKTLAKFICPILQKELDTQKYSAYVEPFVGGGNILENINFKNKIAYDLNNELIAFYQALQKGWSMPKPNSFGPEHYNEVRQSYRMQDGKYPDYYYGYMSIVPSYNGKIWGSYAKEKEGGRHYQIEHYESVLNQLPVILNTKFECKNYLDLKLKNSVIYCDPPYADSQQDYYNKNFNHLEFWQWCREMSKDNKIFISEIKAPNDFKVIWQKEYKRTLANQNKGITSVEKLFTI